MEIRMYLELNDNKKWYVYQQLRDAVKVVLRGKSLALSFLLFHLYCRILDGRENERARAIVRKFIDLIL